MKEVLSGLSPDPIGSKGPASGFPHVDSYWVASLTDVVEDDGPLMAELDADVVVIGGGYTGLSCAYHLSKQHGAQTVVLEANIPGWGCSGRNGGSVRPGFGRVPLAKWVNRWGHHSAKRLFDEQVLALATVRRLLDDGNIDCDLQDVGMLKVAHCKSAVRGLEADCKILENVFGYQAELLNSNEIKKHYFKSEEAFSALKFPDGFGVNPLKLAQGILRMTRNAGGKVFRASPALKWARDGNGYVVTTEGGRVKAKYLVIATNGYTGDGLHPYFRGKTLPVLSNVAVTRPLTKAEKAEVNFISTVPISDTRNLLFYYRLLPDDRILIGGRGPIDERTVNQPKWKEKLLKALFCKFPSLADLKIDYYWAGWVCLPFSSMPHIHHIENHPNVIFSLGYCGTGVAPAIHFGSLVAGRLSGSEVIPSVLARPLQNYPFPAFRRWGQRALYSWYQMLDNQTSKWSS